MLRPLIAAVLLLCALLFLRTSAQASRSDGHFPLKDIPGGSSTTINGNLTAKMNFSGDVNGKNYPGLTEGVTLNPDGSLARFTVSGAGGSIGADVTQLPFRQTTAYRDGKVLDTHFYHAGPRKSTSGPGDARDFTYERLKLRTETHTGGIWAGSWVEFAQDDRGRLERVVVHRAGGVGRTFTLGYDGYSRLNSTTTPGSGATYTRNLDGQLATLTRGAVSTSWGYAADTGLLVSVGNANGGGNSFDFQYSQDGQRRHRSRSGPGISWANLRYDANDQLLGADLSTGSVLAYSYDDGRGNRSAQWGAAHVLNGLDQVTSRTLSHRGFGVFGAVDKQAKARVFSSFRPWWEALAVDAETGGFLGWWDVPVDYNGGAALVVESRVQGILPVAGEARPAMAEALTYVVVPPGLENLAYDSAGRLIADAFWTYQWDYAGRLLQMERQANTSALPGAAGERLKFGYDADGRRTTREHSWKDAGDNWHVKSTSKVLWAGWLPVLEERTRDGADLPRRWFQWGADLSGTLEGAGGIGGLVAVIEEGGRTLLPVQDGLGNICAVIDSGSGQTVARYQFGPFGEPLGESGEADACPFRWQTKWYDAECQHYYFPYRHYDPRLGRWLSRDPLGESGGFNLYAYCGNDPVNRHDPLGLESHGPGADATYNWFKSNGTGLLMMAADSLPIGSLLPAHSDRAKERAEGMGGLARLALVAQPAASLIVPGQKEFQQKVASDLTGGEGTSLAYRLAYSGWNLLSLALPGKFANIGKAKGLPSTLRPPVVEPPSLPRIEPPALPTAARWTPHPEFQMPAADRGHFLGDIGNSPFALSDDAAASMRMPPRSTVPWREGIPDFGAYAVPGPGGIPSTFRVPGLTGAHATDRTLMLQQMAAESGMSQRALQRWLSTSDVRLHHSGGNTVQIVPTKIHSLHHSGGAQQLRGGD